MNEASLEAVRRNGSSINTADIYNAMDRILQVRVISIHAVEAADVCTHCLVHCGIVHLAVRSPCTTLAALDMANVAVAYVYAMTFVL